MKFIQSWMELVALLELPIITKEPFRWLKKAARLKDSRIKRILGRAILALIPLFLPLMENLLSIGVGLFLTGLGSRNDLHRMPQPNPPGAPASPPHRGHLFGRSCSRKRQLRHMATGSKKAHARKRALLKSA